MTSRPDKHDPASVAFATWAVLGISFQVFLPYLIIYVNTYLAMPEYPLVLACVLIGASLVSVLGARLLARRDLVTAVIPATGAFVVGLVACSSPAGCCR